jgi:tetratricopeptide (TPR) repeat protein
MGAALMTLLSSAPNSSPVSRARPCGLLLFLLVAACFLPAVRHGFITYDDPVYVTGNAHVMKGLTWENVRWALRSTEASNWHPLTWVSHMADVQAFGMRPWGHHLTSVLLHALNALLLFTALRRLTGALWRSLFVAALFGLHPLHVESVAWISERKDVLSTTFWMLVLWAYAERMQRIRSGRPGAPALYGLALVLFALGLMCKPMLVTLPCVLLLLDFWPLGRFSGSAVRARWLTVAEKVPFAILSAAACAATLFAQGQGGTVGTMDEFPWRTRAANALISYCVYLGKTFVPVRLAVFYPFTAESPSPWQILAAGALLSGITVAAVALARSRPYVLVGWLWFVGTLIPVIGFVQVGGQALADRYTYLPLVGVFIAMTWSATAIAQGMKLGTPAIASAAAAVLAALCFLTSVQLGYWRDGATLFRHTAAVTQDNWVAHANLYATLARTSSPEAGRELQETLRIMASFADKYDRKGAELERTPGHSAEAIGEYRKAVGIMPDLAGPHLILGQALAKTPGGLPEAIEEFRTAVRLKPDLAAAHYDLGTALAALPNRKADAVTEFETATLLDPDNFQAHYNLAFLLSGMSGREREAVPEYEAAIRLRPDLYQARFNLGLILADIPGRTKDAIAEFEAVLAAKPGLKQARQMIQRLQADAQ